MNFWEFEEKVRVAGIDKGFITDIKNEEEHYRLCFTLAPAPGSEIHGQIWFPRTGWNHRLMATGNSGAAMQVQCGGLEGAVRQKYVCANVDLGTAPDLYRGISNPEVWSDFGWRATHLMAVTAKRMIEAVYGIKPKYSYFMGNSTGGQQGISEALRFPEDFDGIVAGEPALSRTGLHVYFLQCAQNLLRKDGRGAVNKADAEKLSEITKKYLEKREEGEVVRKPYLSKEEKEELLSLISKSGFFTPGQLELLRNIYQGPVNPRTGEVYFSGFPVGAEACRRGIRIYESPEYIERCLYPFCWAFGVTREQYDWRLFDFDGDMERLRQLSPELDCTSADFSMFECRGGKLIMTSGAMDGIIPQETVTKYYEMVVNTMGGIQRTKDFFRYFIIPDYDHEWRAPGGVDWIGHADGRINESGFAKGLGGMADVLTDWVEKGIAPDQICATAFEESIGDSLIPKGKISFQRLVPVYCPEDS